MGAGLRGAGLLLRDSESMPRTASISLSSLLQRSRVLAFALEMVFAFDTTAGPAVGAVNAAAAGRGAVVGALEDEDADDDVITSADAALILRSRRDFRSITGASTSFALTTLGAMGAFLTGTALEGGLAACAGLGGGGAAAAVDDDAALDEGAAGAFVGAFEIGFFLFSTEKSLSSPSSSSESSLSLSLPFLLFFANALPPPDTITSNRNTAVMIV